MADEIVIVESNEEPEPVETPTVVTTVVEDSGDDTSEVVVETAIDHEGRITALEAVVTGMAGVLEEHTNAIQTLSIVDEIQSEQIQDVATVAVEAATEEPEPDPEPEPDDAPLSKLHRWWRGKSD